MVEDEDDEIIAELDDEVVEKFIQHTVVLIVKIDYTSIYEVDERGDIAAVRHHVDQ